jgi:transposase-like protein
MSYILGKDSWLDHVNSWKESGLSINKYCKENGLKYSSFHYWIRKAGRDNPRSADSVPPWLNFGIEAVD